MTPEQARSYIERWRSINRAEIAESRRTQVEVKLRQIDTLMRSVDALGWRPGLEEGEAEVRERWNRLRKVLGE